MQEDVPARAAGSAPSPRRPSVSAPSGMRQPGAGLEDVDQRQAEEQRDGRRDLEVDDRLQADAPHRLQVAGAGDADDQRREQQRRDDHLDHPQERVGERLDGDAERRPDSSRRRCRAARPMKICVGEARQAARRAARRDGAARRSGRRTPTSRCDELRRSPTTTASCCVGGQLAVDRKRQALARRRARRAETRRGGSRGRRSTAAGGTAPGSRSRCRCRARRDALQRVALGASDHELVVDVPAVGRLGRQRRRAVEQPGVAEQRAIARGVRAAAPRSTPARCGAFTRSTAACSASIRKLPPTSVMVVLRLHAVRAQQPRPLRQRVVVGRQQARVAERAEVLAREEREAAERADAAEPAATCRSRRSPAPRPRSPGCRRAAAAQDRIHVGAQAEQVHRHDRLGPRRDRRARPAPDRC